MASIRGEDGSVTGNLAGKVHSWSGEYRQAFLKDSGYVDKPFQSGLGGKQRFIGTMGAWLQTDGFGIQALQNLNGQPVGLVLLATTGVTLAFNAIITSIGTGSDTENEDSVDPLMFAFESVGPITETSQGS